MHTKPIYAILLILLLTACFDSADSGAKSPTANKSSTSLSLQPLFNDLSFKRPVGIYQAKNKHWFVVEQSGVVYQIDSTTQQKQEFINISDKVSSRGEMGLLGLALDPNFTDNGVLYLSYTGYDNYSYISRFYSDKDNADKSSEEVVLKQKQPYANHNGGHIAFGPDGNLYIGFGDGGSAGDPEENGQNLNTLLGAILRIDVSKGDPYSIPDTNPFINQKARPEIFAYGLRNPWRFSFDKLTGDLWAGDVGQNAWEEIDLIKKGGNYGWNIMEGTHCFTAGKCESANYIAPVFDYGRDQGQSVTGGFVYRGDNIPELQGSYIYGDFMSGRIWALSINENQQPVNTLLLETGANISSFGEDLTGELYAIAYSGQIYALTKK